MTDSAIRVGRKDDGARASVESGRAGATGHRIGPNDPDPAAGRRRRGVSGWIHQPHLVYAGVECLDVVQRYGDRIRRAESRGKRERRCVRDRERWRLIHRRREQVVGDEAQLCVRCREGCKRIRDRRAAWSEVLSNLHPHRGTSTRAHRCLPHFDVVVVGKRVRSVVVSANHGLRLLAELRRRPNTIAGHPALIQNGTAKPVRHERPENKRVGVRSGERRATSRRGTAPVGVDHTWRSSRPDQRVRVGYGPIQNARSVIDRSVLHEAVMHKRYLI